MPLALLSFPGLDLSNWFLHARPGVLETKSWPGDPGQPGTASSITAMAWLGGVKDRVQAGNRYGGGQAKADHRG
jgi:hypothetical protein